MIRRAILIGWVITFLVAAFDSAHSADPFQQAEKAACESMLLADWLRDQSMDEDAIDLYTEALGIFKKIARKYPAQANMVAAHAVYCRKQLGKLKVSSPAPGASKPGSAGVIGPALEAKSAPGVAREMPVKNQYEEKYQAALRLERSLEYREALELYSAVLVGKPDYMEAMKGSARCYLHLGSVDKARELLQQVLAGNADDAEACLLQASVLCYDREYASAIPLLSAPLRTRAFAAQSHLVIGVARMGLDEIEAAQEEMKRALSLNSKLSEAYYNLARISMLQVPLNLPVTRVHYQNALRYGAEPDLKLEEILR